MKKILFISGSLRKESFNKQLLEMAAQRLSSDFECTFLDYSDLPLLNQGPPISSAPFSTTAICRC